ncbi:MAG: EAL domain-containing protein [Campylobacter sp.]|nr:EAL domain-containing protein [Campylobacter sp.]
MLNKITNNHTAIFLYVVAVYLGYGIALYLGDQFYCDVISVLLNASIAIFMLYRLKTSNNLNSHWVWIVLGVIGWAVADMLFVGYYRVMHQSGERYEERLFVQIIYFVPFISFLIASIVMFVRSAKNGFWTQVLIDAGVIILIYASFFWFVIFERDLSAIMSAEYIFPLAYIFIDIVMFCIVFIVYFSTYETKKQPSFSFCLAALGIFCIYDMYYSVITASGEKLINTYFELLLEFVFILFFVSTLHMKQKEARLKFHKNVRDFHKILINKLLLLVFMLGLAIVISGKIDLMWGLFIMILMLAYAVLTHSVSNVRNNRLLIKKERSIKQKLNIIIEERVEELNRTNKRLKQLSEYDFLTGALNRPFFLTKLEEIIKTKALGENIDIYSVDINHFKAVNDSYGHYIGDETLSRLVENIKSILPKGSLLARFGGDDFMIVVKQKRDRYFREFLSKLHTVISEPILIEGYKISLSAKIGFSTTATSEILAEDLIAQAVTALNSAKKNNLVTHVFYDDIKDAIQEQNYIEILLNSIDFDREFRLNFQPQYLIEGKKLVGAEALIRWYSPIKGFVSPGLFIPIAEQSSIINSIGKWVAKEAIKQMAIWNERYGTALRIGINVSPKQIDNVNFASDILNFIKEYGIDPKCVDVEITEASLVNAEEIMQSVLGVFSSNGMSISIDDFGTGFSSMNYIKKYTLNKLKIAKELVDNIAANEIDKDVVTSIISLAKNISLRTIAEGVEDATQLEILKNLGCNEIQGYFWGKPMSAADFEELIKSSI